MMDTRLISILQNELSTGLHHPANDEELLTQVQQIVSELIMHDFSKLVNILYRVDVSERLLKQLLKANTDKDAASIIARLIVERQKEKIKTRFDTGHPEDPENTEEKW